MAKQKVVTKRVKKLPAAKTAARNPRPKRAKPAPAKATPKPEKVVRKKSQASTEGKLKKIDRDLLKLIQARIGLTVEVMKSTTEPPLGQAAHSESELWQQLAQFSNGESPSTVVRSVFREILSAARSRIKLLRVAYLGPQYSFTHLAAIERFGQSADLIQVNTIASVFEEVNRGHADFGIVPIENSTDGRIVDTLDMFTRLPLRICGEVQIAIHHNLLSKFPRGEIAEIYSKQQALSQCRDWLARNMPMAKAVEVTSTSLAAQIAQNKPNAAAIASKQAAVQYGLPIVAENIEDNPNNITRFAVIGGHEPKPTGRDRTALLLQIPHAPGSLSDALAAFKRNKINLSWIESFPLRGPESGYLFFLDFEGHSAEQRVKKALEEVRKIAVRMEVLGSYPRSEPHA